jgi:mRNA interferase RelE/StbE
VSAKTRVIAAAIALGENPRPPGCKKLKGREEYRVRVGDYRIIYEIRGDILTVLVVRVAHRSEAYR